MFILETKLLSIYISLDIILNLGLCLFIGYNLGMVILNEYEEIRFIPKNRILKI